MLMIILNWIYILFTCFSIGYVFSIFVKKSLHYSIKHLDSILISGLVIANVYAQIFSLFGGVSTLANGIMIVGCIVACIAAGRQMAAFLRDVWKSCPLSCRILIPFLFLLWSYFTSRGYMVTDADLYHGQSIRWIEEYGVIKGLGNLHMRFGYNSSFFALSALYSMKFLLGRSLHAVNGFIAFLLSTVLLDLHKCFRRRKMLLSDYARIGAVYYLSTIWDEIIAPSSDYAVMCVIFYIVIKWLMQLEEEDREQRDNIAPYALLCVVAAYALTLKVTAGLILLLLVWPAYRLLVKKRWKEIGIYLFLGLIVSVPWFVRTVIITGWLLYPFPGVDLFQVDWKMPETILSIDAFYIRAWGRGINQLPYGSELSGWIPNWFLNELSFTEKLLILGDIFSCAATMWMTIVAVIKRRWEKLDILLVLVTMSACYLFWQCNAPMPRYGYSYMLLLVSLTVGYIVEKTGITRILYVFFCVYGIYKLYICGDYIVASYREPNYVWQCTYSEGGRESCEVDGVVFYYSLSGQLPGYDPFPAVIGQPPFEFELRGESLKDGLRYK